jgi:hypothetical protein
MSSVVKRKHGVCKSMRWVATLAMQGMSAALHYLFPPSSPCHGIVVRV